MNSTKILKYLIPAVVVLVAVAFYGKKKGWFGGEMKYKVATEKVIQRNIIETITANGKIQPEKEVKISPDVSGEIVELYIKEGAEVKKGDLLLKINPEIYLANLERVRAALNSSKAQLAQADAQFIDKKASFTRMKTLKEKGAISEAEFETAESAYKVGKANVDAAKYSIESTEASLKEAKESLTKTNIYSPISGTISMLNVEQGERVVGTAQFAGTELLRIANLDQMEVKVEVNENDIVRVSLGDTALIEVDAYLDQKFKGVVSEIANSANVTGLAADQVTSFNVKIRVLQESYKELIKENNPYPFRPGMSATVDVQTHMVQDVLTVPIQAVTTRADTSFNKQKDRNGNELMEIVFVYNDKDLNVSSRKVKTGIQDDNNIEVLEGLSAEDEIVVSPYSVVSKKLKDGSLVIKVDKETLFNEKD